MAWFTTSGVEIVGMAAAVPTQKADAEFHSRRFDRKEIEKFIKSTGVECSRWATEDQTASDLGYAAAENLLKQMNIDRRQIGILAFLSCSSDYRKPATACVLQMRLGLLNSCASIDIALGCAGFVYGDQIVRSLVSSADAEYGLLILGETPTKTMGVHDRTSMLFGDAGAAVLYKKKNCNINKTILCTDGYGYKTIILPAGGFRDLHPSHEEYMCPDGVMRSKYDVYMDGLKVFAFSVNDVAETMKEFFFEMKTDVTFYDKIFIHQANQLIIRQLCKKFKIAKEKVPIILNKYGNTSSTSIPLAICDQYGGDESIKPENVLAVGFGIGLSWGVTSFEIAPQTVLPVIESEDCFSEGKIDLRNI